MKLQSEVVAGLAVAFLCMSPPKAQSKDHRVLFALTSAGEADWQLSLHTMGNFISGVAPEMGDVGLVAYGPGIAFLKKDGPDAGGLQR